MDVKEPKPTTTSSASILDRAHDNRIDRAKFTNVAGNSISNTFILIKLESGIGVGGVIVLSILAFLFFRLLL